MNNPSPWLLAQASLKFFTVKFLKLSWLPHYDEWEKIAIGEARADVQAPRGHGKSKFWSFAVPLWDVIRGEADVLLVSYSEDQVRRLIRDIRVEVESNPFLEPIRPSTKEIWGTDMLSFSDGGQISGLGFGTSSRGKHPKRIIVDDPLKDMGGMSPEDQERAYFGVITGMAMPYTKLTTVGTPIDFDDLLMKLESNPVYKHWRKPAIGDDGKPLCPELFSDETLKMRRQEMGAINFAREYMLERIDPATQPFKNQYETLYDVVPGRFNRIVTVCDPAYTEGEGDATAVVTVGFTHGNHAYVLEAKRIHLEEPGKVVDELFRTICAYNPESVGIEKKKGQALHYSFLERRTRLNLWNFKYVELSHGNKSKDDASRVGGLVPRWESRAIHIHKNMRDLLQELYRFRFESKGGKTKGHDDLVDALAYCFHEEMIQPNAGASSVPMDEEELLQVGRGYYGVGQMVGAAAYQMNMNRTRNYGQMLAEQMDKRLGD